MSQTLGLKINIIEFVDSSQPGFVNCSFTDSLGFEHRFFEKVPVVTDGEINENSDLPEEGIIKCVVLDPQPDKKNSEIVTIEIDEPLQCDKTVFQVYKSQLTDYENWTSEK